MKKYVITVNSKQYEVEVEEVRAAAPAARKQVNGTTQAQRLAAASSSKSVNGTAGKTLVAPMPGNVLKVLVAEGEKVTKDQPVLVFEAMKMENNLTAPADGTIVTLNVKEGSVMSVGDVLLVIE